MNWNDDGLCAAALRLLLTRRLRSSKAAAPLLLQLEELGLAGPTRRVDEYQLYADSEAAFRQYLKAQWPQFSELEADFVRQPETISASALRARRRAALALPSGIKQLNRKTWSAWIGAHSKSGQQNPPDGVTLTVDELLRFRPNAGLCLLGQEGERLPLDQWYAVMGEVSMPERALARRWQLAGTLPRVVITVENIGAFVDFRLPPWLLLVHAPGWNTTLALRFLANISPHIPWLHFGDLDPNGIRIGLTIQCPESGRRPRCWIPRSAALLLASHSLPLAAPWPTDHLPAEVLTDPVISQLIGAQCWMEHESLVLLPEFFDELNTLA